MAKTQKKAPAKKPKTGRKPKIDWDQARKDYLSDSTLSLADNAKKYGVSTTIVERKASKESWAEVRKKLGNSAFEEFQKRLVDEKSRAQNRHLIQYQNLQAIINKAVVAFSTGTFWTDKKGNLILDKDNQPIPRPPDAKQLEALAKAAKVSMDGERTVLGLPTNVQGLTDGKGDSVWTGFSDMVKAARKVKEDAANGSNSS